MATSESEGEIRISATELGTDRFVAAAMVRDLTDSALHKCDMAGQVQANWCAPSSNVWPAGGLTFYEPAQATFGSNAPGANEWNIFSLRTRYIPRRRANGDGYSLRVRLAVSLGAAGTCSFGVVALPGALGQTDSEEIIGTGSTAAFSMLTYSSVSDTQPTWQSADGGSDVLAIPATLCEEAVRIEPRRTTEIDLGGAPTVLIRGTIQVLVVCKPDAGSLAPKLHALHVAEISP